MIKRLRLGLVGLGKIARDQHLPAIGANDALDLIAVASLPPCTAEVPVYDSVEEMLAACDVDAVVMCQPPQARHAAARAALLAGKHVFLEKPPGATISEVQALHAIARERGVTLFTSWHSREAAAVSAAREWLASRILMSASLVWKEDVRVWHPGQTWLWQPGGFGVFDPGINALSILTAILPAPINLVSADFAVPSNCHAPIAAKLALRTVAGVPITADLDFLHDGEEQWEIRFATDDGEALLADGGNRWSIDGEMQTLDTEQEYAALYRHFVALVAQGACDVDLAPLQLTADAFLIARSRAVDAFTP